MRISDWSSDVCSSDLYSATAMLREKFQRREMSVEEIAETAQVIAQHSLGNIGFSGLMTAAAKFMKGVDEESFVTFGEELYKKHIARKIYPETRAIIEAHRDKGHRSEEHTYELQSILRISYAVFFLKKQNIKQKTNITLLAPIIT